jgi:2-succinyl-6-hydroxy-2,4-cyclohexadiene-1-carboxylate synthase
MGGRAALSFASAYPGKISALILESTSAGIEKEKERNERIKNDEKLARFILNNSIGEFVDKWIEMEIFKSQKTLPKENLAQLKNAKSKNSKTGLANSLRGFGTGMMPHPGNQIKKMGFPVLLITGELDKKFTKINRDLICEFPYAEHKIITSAGHNVHLEKPKDFISAIGEYLIQF